ncbi:MAG: glycosyltransferase [Candidatus Marsarchaeota archaeon]|nr:glycosyltransferase [Candidatus Marsarchaeota archaeon]
MPDSQIWYVNLYLPLVDLGHQLVTFDYDYGPLNHNLDPMIPEHREFIVRNRPLFSEELLKQVRAAHHRQPVDVFFSYFYSSYVEANAIREIGRMGITTINWYCNGSYQFHLVEEIAPAYHYCLVPEKFRLADYRRIGANPIYCQEAANPNIYRPFDLPREFDVTFVGQRYGNRPAYVSCLLDAGMDVRVWGPFWQQAPMPISRWRLIGSTAKSTLRGRKPAWVARVPQDRCGPPLSDDELIKMYSRSKISLGFSMLAGSPSDGAPNKQVRLRDFEAPMSGAFYLVEYFEELAEFFEPDKDIVCFDSPEEAVEKTRYYLAHDSERERIRHAGLNRARSEHTWHKRFEMVFQQIGLK